MKRGLIPLAVFIILVVFLSIGLSKDPRKVPSPFIDKPAPAFNLPQLKDSTLSFSPDEMIGKVWVLNIWASWCVSCRAEHEVLNSLVKNQPVNLIGLNYKDNSDSARLWLQRYGNPYQVNVVDIKGITGIDWGVYAVPETFIIDKQGIVRYKHTGPVSNDDVEKILIPILNNLEKS